MIPIFAFFALCTGAGLLHTLFPGLFPAAGRATMAGHAIVVGVYRRARNLTRDIAIYGTLALTIWFGLIVLALQFKRWEFAAVGLASTGFATLVSAVLLFTAKAVLTGTLTRINEVATEWSAAIRLQTVPFSRQNYKLPRLLVAPLYGFYLLLVLPAKAMLEIVKAVCEFGPTLGNWINRIVVIISAVSVCSWFLSGLVLFQLEFSMDGPLDPFILGLCLMFIATLIALLLMTGSPLVKVLEFIQSLGFINLLLLSFIAFHHFRPDIANPMLTVFTNRWAGLVYNIGHYPCLAMLFMVGVTALCCRMPWPRAFAGPISLGLLILWIFSTDFASHFYFDLGWWIGLIGLTVSWMYMKEWVVPVSVIEPPAATPSTASAPTAPTAAPHAPAAPVAAGTTPAASAAADVASTVVSLVKTIIAVSIAVLALVAVAIVVLIITGVSSGIGFNDTTAYILLAVLFVACVIGLLATSKGGGSHVSEH